MARTWLSIRVELVEGRAGASGLGARAAYVTSRAQSGATGRRNVGAMPSCPGGRLQLRPW